MGKAQKWKIEKRIQLERGEFGTLIASCNKSAGAVINIDFEIVPLHDACMCGGSHAPFDPLHLDLSLILAAEMKIVFQSYSCRLPFPLTVAASTFPIFPLFHSSVICSCFACRCYSFADKRSFSILYLTESTVS